jgi:hypothetical protein
MSKYISIIFFIFFLFNFIWGGTASVASSEEPPLGSIIPIVQFTVIMLVLPDSARSLEDSGSVSQYTRISQSRQVFQLFFANHHKISQNFNILTFDLKTAQKVQNRNNCIKTRFIRRLFATR